MGGDHEIMIFTHFTLMNGLIFVSSSIVVGIVASPAALIACIVKSFTVQVSIVRGLLLDTNLGMQR